MTKTSAHDRQTDSQTDRFTSAKLKERNRVSERFSSFASITWSPDFTPFIESGLKSQTGRLVSTRRFPLKAARLLPSHPIIQTLTSALEERSLHRFYVSTDRLQVLDQTKASQFNENESSSSGIVLGWNHLSGGRDTVWRLTPGHPIILHLNKENTFHLPTISFTVQKHVVIFNFYLLNYLKT